jgi:hypothetical protein
VVSCLTASDAECRTLAHGAGNKNSLVGSQDFALAAGAMDLIQIYDTNGVASLKGGSKFKHHIDWLQLLLLQTSSPTWGAHGSEAPLLRAPGSIVFTTPVAPVLMNAFLGKSGIDRWRRAIVDRCEDQGDKTWLFRMTLQKPLVDLFSSLNTMRDETLTPTPIAQVTLSYMQISVDFRHPDVRL